ncbi:hypothetical protein B296_00034857 [Ensete ventricosum]|uniref:Uncharacterized protein n=1 Tax=Ensete ventricosum TaxID=4639 RepID=A0A427A3W9_ENSVE|nr:hypothetical protein B296_00034857 [Ensete ventricosum]
MGTHFIIKEILRSASLHSLPMNQGRIWHVSGWMVLTEVPEQVLASTGRLGLLQRTGNPLLKRKKLRVLSLS